MVGYEYEYRAAEPFFASEALEEEPEGIVDIGYSLVWGNIYALKFFLLYSIPYIELKFLRISIY